MHVKVLKYYNCLFTKLKVYIVIVLTFFLFGCETWTLYCRNIKWLEQFHMCTFWSILHIHWQDMITHSEVMESAKSSSFEATLLKTQFNFAGNVISKEDHHMLQRLMYGELLSGNQNQGHPHKRQKDNIKENFRWCSVNEDEVESVASD